MSPKLAVLGGGSWGTALAQTLCRTGSPVALWSRDPRIAEAIAATRHNPRYLTEIALDAAVTPTAALREAVDEASIVFLAVPTHAMREVATSCRDSVSDRAVLVSAAKGFDAISSCTMSEVLCDVLGDTFAPRVTAMSGPNIAVEIAMHLPAASVVAGPSDAAEEVRDTCSHDTFRLYSTADCVGVEYAGALKNIVAIAAGACDGMGAGDNGKAAIMTRGLAEMARLGVASGASVMTFAGLAGIGDCVVTCASPHSRNRRLGEAIARGASLESALAGIRMVAEGVDATRVAVRLAEARGVDMPITREVHAVLFEGKPVAEGLADLMHRDPADELRGLQPLG
ncbi:MAG: NAD(P)-dependent glycerol-3-phosphate dehydrogenase [Candidatus Dormibacteraeota bacterium]|nr:NAD(P)-dependent glycerol-3-phosphate dehydrogenase [Candidatus Dormibacteraeota bacterium]